MKQRTCMIVIFTAFVVACGEDPVQLGNEPVFDLLRQLVSNPVSANAAAGGNSAAANEVTVAYVSLPPETYPDGVVADIVNAANGYKTSVTLENGGFDPVPVPSAVGDTLFITVSDSSRTIGSERAVVPPEAPPLIVRTRPAKGKVDVPLNLLNVTVVFDEPIDRLTVTAQTIRLHRGSADGVQLDGEFVLQANGFVADLTLSSPLELGTEYTLVVTTDIRDLSGDALPNQEVVSFETFGIGGFEDSFNYTIKVLGVGNVGGISEGGRMVGYINGQNAVWDSNDTLIVPDPSPGESRSFGAWTINRSGTQVVGTMSDGRFQQAVRWEIDGQTITPTVLQPLAGLGHTSANPSGVNDLGQVVGQSSPDVDKQRAVLWDADGTPRDLGELPGHTGSWARAINNAGHIVGRSGLGAFGTPGAPHAVLWILGADGQVTLVDLTPHSDHTGDNHAGYVSNVAADGTIQVTGYTTVAREQRATLWTVDVQNGGIITQVLTLAGASEADAMNSVGQVLVRLNGVPGAYPGVWTRVNGLDLIERLPLLAPPCARGGGGFTDSGTIVGSSSVSQGESCVSYIVEWTKK